MNIRQKASVMLAAILMAGLPIHTAAANHDDSPWYNARWSSSGAQHRDVHWSFASNFPTIVNGGDSFRGAAKTGANAWTTQTPETYMQFVYDSGDYINMDWDTDCSDEAGPSTFDYYQLDILGFGDVLPGAQDTAYALTRLCTFDDVYHTGSNSAYNFSILVSQEWSWYYGESTFGIPFTAVDLQSVIAHEFGHATGRTTGGNRADGHYDYKSSICPETFTSTDQTMCPLYPRGATWFRTLETHDRSSFGNVLEYD